MLGNFSADGVASYWEHLSALDAWKSHPVIMRTANKAELVPVTLHADGAEMFRNNEFFVYSWSSAFSAHSTMLKDPLMQKFPIAVVPEMQMQDESAACLNVTLPKSIWSMLACFLCPSLIDCANLRFGRA